MFAQLASPLNDVIFVNTCGLYYKTFRIVIYDRNAIAQYYKTTIVVMANYDCI